MQVISRTYPNGLRSLSVLSHDTQAVTVMFLVSVGARYEDNNEAGLAHFVEHTLFKGTEKRPSSKQIGMEIESLGGSSNAFTAQDYTGYYIKSPAINFADTFEILSDMFMNSQFREQDLEKEKGVIIEEIRMYEDRPTSKVAQIWQENYFQGNNLGKDIAGTIDSVRAMKRDQFFDYINKHYYAENVLVVVAGNVEQNQVEEMVTKYCLGIKKAGPKLSNYDPFQFQLTGNRKREVCMTKDVQQAHLILGGPALNRDDDRKFSLEVANTILANGFGSRLFQVIRDELGLAYYVYSRLLYYAETGVFQIGMGVDPQRIDEAVAAAKKQLVEIREGKYTQEEFSRAKNYLLGNIITDLESSDDIASFYGMQELLNNRKYSIDETKQRILAVSMEDIKEITEELFQEDKYYLAMLAPS